MTGFVLRLIRAYQHTLSHVFGGACRFYPSCSQYTYEAVERYGWWRGGRLGAWRVVRCNPFTRGGYDPVP